MRSRLLVGGAFAALLALAMVRPASAQGTLEGAVTAAGTGAALAGAQVSLPGLTLGGTTSPSGVYRITGIPAGTHTVEIRLIGYGTEVREVTVSSGRTVNLDVALAETVLVLEGLVAVGSRAQPRAVTQSPVPVDAIAATEFINQGDTDLSNLLRNIAPSYNVNMQPISDAATISRPANLRNLAPDHTLVLVNGKRRHRGAIITWLGNGVADGAQGADIAVIPAIALRQVEILRDGASAQYGSDAIAGVMNFQLRDDRDGKLRMEAKTGSYPFYGDGQSHSFAGNVGLPLGETGFVNLSAEYGNVNPTDRSVQRNDALLLIGAGNSNVRRPAQIWGSPHVEDDLKLWANYGAFLGENVQFYGHGNYASRKVTGGFFFRNPNTRGAVFSGDGGKTLLVGDMLDAQDGVLDGSANCPVVNITRGVPDPEALQQVFDDPNCFSFQELFPGGFTPNFGGDATDASFVGGLKGEFGDLGWDASVGWGRNHADFFIYNTVNASLGPAQPTGPPGREGQPLFDPGDYIQEDFNINLDLTWAASEGVNIAAGAERREEGFEIVEGQVESWTFGPLADQGFSAASNGFPGFSPIAAGDWARSNIAVYGDVEIRDPDAGRWTVGGAVRYENFSDFGRTFNYKFAARYGFNESFALRGSASTGFRAPTTGQQNAFNVSTVFDNDLGDLVNRGTIPSTSEVAALRGGKQLEPEKSVNIAFGAVAEVGALDFTVDYFRIRLTDRLSQTQTFKLTGAEVDQLIREGITSARNLREFRFFTNDFNTTTQGVDVVATYAPESLRGNTTLTLLYNFTDTDVTTPSSQTLGEDRIRQLEEALPRNRWNVTVNQFAGDWRLLGRLNWYGGWFDGELAQEAYDGAATMDLEAAYSLDENTSFTIGGQNVLNRLPQEIPNPASVGNRYSESTPWGFNGAYFYAKVNYAWGW